MDRPFGGVLDTKAFIDCTLDFVAIIPFSETKLSVLGGTTKSLAFACVFLSSFLGITVRVICGTGIACCHFHWAFPVSKLEVMCS
jgi:hypothetical protein